MPDTPIPERVTNKDLYKLHIESISERAEMEKRLTKNINGVSTRVAILETKIEDVEEIKDDLKKRDSLGYFGTLITFILAGFGILDK